MKIKINDLQREALEYHSGLVPHLDKIAKTYVVVGGEPRAFDRALTQTINTIREQNRRMGISGGVGTIALQSVRRKLRAQIEANQGAHT